MKKIIAAILVVASVLMATSVSVSAITKSDKPLAGGPTVWNQAEIMYTGEPTASSKWSNAFCNEDWTGSRWTAETVDGLKVVRIVPVAGKTANYMDFNYYQWNNDKYYPSLKCGDYSYLVAYIKPNASAAKATKGRFWASSDSTVLSKTKGTATIDFDMKLEADKWQKVVIDCSGAKFSDGVAWKDETIRQFRFYPFGASAAAADAVVYLQYLAFFKTESEAKLYDPNKVVAATTTAKAATTTAAAAKTAAKAPQTADPITFVILASVASLGVVLTSSKKRSK